MKTYNETINTVFERIDDYKLKRLRKKKIIMRVAIPALSMCLAVAVGVFAFKGDIFKSNPLETLEDSTVIGEKDYIEPNDVDSDDNNTSTTIGAPADMLGSVQVGEITYLQCSIDDTLFTADKCLGDAKDFEGYYKEFSDDDISTELYTVKESPNVMMVKLSNGGTVILARVGEIIVDGKTYFSTQWVTDEFTVDKYLGRAEDYELIEVPYRETFIVPQDEIWTVQENTDILLVKQSNGDICIMSVLETE